MRPAERRSSSGANNSDEFRTSQRLGVHWPWLTGRMVSPCCSINASGWACQCWPAQRLIIVGRVRPGARAQHLLEGDQRRCFLRRSRNASSASSCNSTIESLARCGHAFEIGHASTAIPGLDRHVRALTDPHHRWHGRSSAQNFRGILGVPLYSLGVLNQFGGYEIALCASDR